MEKAPHILMGVARGKLHPIDYKHLEFPKIIIYPVSATNAAIQKQAYLMRKAETFIGWCIRHTQDHSECWKIYGWIRGDQHLDGAESAEELKKAMKKHPEKWFNSEHYNLIDRIHDVYTNEET